MLRNTLLCLVALLCVQPTFSNSFINYSHNSELESIEVADCEENLVLFHLETGSAASEISWNILHNGLVVAEGSGYEDNTEYFEELCLEDGCYTMQIFSEGDDWNGANFSLTLGNLLLTWGPFSLNSYSEQDFHINAPWCSQDGIVGCIDPEAENYNPQAYISDQSCLYGDECSNQITASVSTEESWDVFSWTIQQGQEIIYSGGGYEDPQNYIENLCLEDGCYTLHMNGWVYGTINLEMDGQVIAEGQFGGSAGQASLDFTVNYCEVPGCTDPEATNYNPEANVDDGSCLFGCYAVEILHNNSEVSDDIFWSLELDGSVYSSESENDSLCIPAGCYTLTLEEGTEQGLQGIFQVFVNGEEVYDLSLYTATDSLTTQLSVASPGCGVPVLEGCTDPEAVNYDEGVIEDDGSCFYEDGCDGNEVVISHDYQSGVSSDFMEFEIHDSEGNLVTNGNAHGAAGINYVCLEDGCYTFTLSEVPEFWQGAYQIFPIGDFSIDWDGEYEGGPLIFVNGAESGTYEVEFSINSYCGDGTPGCTDPEAENYNPEATVDDGSCEYESEVDNDLCQDAAPLLEGTQLISNVGANSNEGIFGDCWAFGNGKGEQSSVWYTFTTPEEPAAITIEAITDGTNTFTDTQFGLFEECGGEMIYCDGNSGEGLMSKFEFACGELEPNTTYILLVDGYQGDNGTCYLEYTVDGSCEGSDECEANPALVNIVTNTWSEEISWAILQEGEIVAEGSGYEENNYQYTEEICLEDGCYTFEMYDSFGDGWNGGSFSIWLEDGTFITSGELETGEYGSVTFGVNADCEEEIEGCIDPEAINYNPEATIDDGSCEYSDCDENEILVQLNAGASFEWSFENSEEYLEEGGDSGLGAIEEFSFCVEDGCYNFTIYDFSDSEWTGLVSIYVNGQTYLIESITNDSNLSFDIAVNGNCEEEIAGCTDPEAVNYNPEATVDDGSCDYSDCGANEILVQLNAGPGAFFEWSFENAEEYLEGGGYNGQGAIEEYTFCVEDGCYNFTISDFSESDWTGLICIYINGEVYLIEQIYTDSNLSFDIGVNSECGEIEGCIDPEANNYDPVATVDDGSCVYDCHTVEFLLNGNSLSENIIWSLENDSTSYSSNQLDDTFCAAAGCYTFTFENTSQESWNGFLQIFINGQEEVTANINSFVDIYEFSVGVGAPSCGVPVIEGCTDPEAVNFDPGAIEDNGSCFYEGECDGNLLHIGNDPNSIFSTGTDFIHFQIFDTEGNLVNGGNSSNAVGDNFVCLEDGCYTFSLSNVPEYWSGVFFLHPGLQNDFEIDWDGTGIPGLTIDGSISSSYELDFSINSECDSEEVEGCTDPEATNYDPEATFDDGSCIYPAECSISFDLLADSSNLNTIFVIPSDSIGEAVAVLWDFGDGTTSTDLFPNHEYEGDGPYNLCLTVYFEVGENDTCDVTFCMEVSADMIPYLFPGAGGNSSGFFINVIDDASTIGVAEQDPIESIEMYPNPTADFVYITSASGLNTETTINIYNIHGSILKSHSFSLDAENGNHKIDLSGYSSGMYFIKVSSDSNHKTFRVLKN